MTPAAPPSLDATVDAVLAHVLDATDPTGPTAQIHVRALELRAWRLGMSVGRAAVRPAQRAVAPRSVVVVVN